MQILTRLVSVPMVVSLLSLICLSTIYNTFSSVLQQSSWTCLLVHNKLNRSCIKCWKCWNSHVSVVIVFWNLWQKRRLQILPIWPTRYFQFIVCCVLFTRRYLAFIKCYVLWLMRFVQYKVPICNSWCCFMPMLGAWCIMLCQLNSPLCTYIVFYVQTLLCWWWKRRGQSLRNIWQWTQHWLTLDMAWPVKRWLHFGLRRNKE